MKEKRRRATAGARPQRKSAPTVLPAGPSLAWERLRAQPKAAPPVADPWERRRVPIEERPIEQPDGTTTTLKVLFPGLYAHPSDPGSPLAAIAERQTVGLADAALVRQEPCGVCTGGIPGATKGLGKHDWWCPWWTVTGAVPF